jgi:hypothetical protein
MPPNFEITFFDEQVSTYFWPCSVPLKKRSFVSCSTTHLLGIELLGSTTDRCLVKLKPSLFTHWVIQLHNTKHILTQALVFNPFSYAEFPPTHLSSQYISVARQTLHDICLPHLIWPDFCPNPPLSYWPVPDCVSSPTGSLMTNNNIYWQNVNVIHSPLSLSDINNYISYFKLRT